MEQTRKRSKSTEELISHSEAASLLGVTARAVRWMIQRGALQSSTVEGKIRLADVSNLAHHLARGFDLTKVAHLAVRALLSSSRAERRLDRIEALMGIDCEYLELTEENITSIYQRAQDLLVEYTEDMEAEQVMEWARIFANINEEFLEAVQYMLADDEPWKVFILSAQKLYDSAPSHRFWNRKDLETAYGYLASARRHLRQVSYFYVRHMGKRTKRLADKLFPEMKDGGVDEQIIDLIFAKK